MRLLLYIGSLVFLLQNGTCITTNLTMKTTTTGVQGHECPNEPRCDCLKLNTNQNTMLVNCFRRGLSYIPLLNTPILKFDLSFNEIKYIPEKSFENAVKMRELDLSNNVIEVLFTNSFVGAISLRILNLAGNKLCYKDTVFLPDCFLPLLHLETLNMENNVGDLTIGQVYPKLTHLKYLENLTMDGVQDPYFATKLENLVNLQFLKMSNFSGICKLKTLPADIFKYTPNLRVIDLSNCEISKIQPGTFKNLTHLAYLDLSNNEKLQFEGVHDVLHDLQFTSIKILKLNKIHETFHLNIKIPYNISKPLSNTSLEQLHIDNNRIQLCDVGVLPNLAKTLFFISAVENEFSFGLYILETRSMNIVELNLSNLYPTRDIFSGRISKRNTLDQTDVLYKYSGNTKNSNIKYQFRFSSIGNEINHYIPLPRNLKKFYINRPLLRFSIPKWNFVENNLEHVDVSDNLATEWIGPVNNLTRLKYLDASGNFCSNVSDIFFSMLGNLEILLLNNNLLIIRLDFNGKILSALCKVKVLNLSQNRIKTIPKDFLKSQVALERLDLSHNLVTELNFHFNHMQNLSFIDLSHNFITSLEESVIMDIEIVHKKQKLTMDLSNNPLECNCETVEFVKWLATTTVDLKNLKKYTCIVYDKTKIDLQNPTFTYQALTKDCSKHGFIIAPVSFGLVLFVSIVVCGIVYRYRWKLRYIYYMTKQKYQGYELLKDSATDYVYDAFVSYADEDQVFVHGELITNLEVNGDFKLCLHKRDFLPGHAIAGNITNAISNSRKTIVVLTEHFLNSYRCMFEFNMARMESLYAREGKNVLFLILLEHVATKDMPLIMLELVQSDSFIEYPNDLFGNNIFWVKLSKVLQ